MSINLQYPVLLVHGAGFRDKLLGINYWGRIPKKIESAGIKVFYGGTDAWGSIEHNAGILKNTIEKIITENNIKKVNIIAHSRGGLEARYLISTLQFHDAVASLTTISTPHRGVKAMNIALHIPGGLYKIASFFVNVSSKILGDKKPDFYTSSRQLSEKACTEFNKANVDNQAVYYQSYAAKMKHAYSDLLYIWLHPFLMLTDGENDGLCPAASAQWGVFKGVITGGGRWGISHTGILDAYRIKYKGIDIPAFYVSILKELAENGY